MCRIARNPETRPVAVALLCVVLTMLINVSHPYLWGPDEPREAEIAREALTGRDFVTPHLCGLPFLEKPPLYYDMVAASFALTGRTTPPVARGVSVLLGCIMLSAVFFFGRIWGGNRRGLLAVLVLESMPQFYRYSHWILLDIGVGTFCTLALVAFAYLVFWARDGQDRLALFLFYMTTACAFLTKGVVGIFHISVIVGAFIILKRDWGILRRMLSSLSLLAFLVPVGIWIYLYYREGGICYLNELFINDVFGRFLRVRFELSGCHFYNTDLGNRAPWYFYIQRISDMVGFALLFLPFTIWDGRKSLVKALSATADRESDIFLFLIIWAFLPGILLSFSSIKEVSYVLPSYAGIAIMIGGWLDERLPHGSGIWWLVAVIPIVFSTVFLSPRIGVRTYLAVTIGYLVLALPFIPVLFWKRHFGSVVFLYLALALGGTVIANTPKVIYETRLKWKCYSPLAQAVWSHVGDRMLYLYRPRDTLRGSIPFYRGRLTPEIDRPAQLRSVLESGKENFILMRKDVFDRIVHRPPFETLIERAYHLVPLPELNLHYDYVLISNTIRCPVKSRRETHLTRS